ncbi:MAG: hypothetical protein FJ303_23640 [Planctomycetes bacterium]|nr:hypothetical protein [Planctomycetota bacterium]
MQTTPVEQVAGHLIEVIDKLSPSAQNDKPVTKLTAMPRETPRPMPGRSKGMLTIISEDDDHLQDFAEYMP